MMYRQNEAKNSSLKRNTSYIGERIEEKVRRILTSKEPIKDGAPLVYTDRKDGVRPEYDIRTDRFELAVAAMDTVSKQHLAKRDAGLKPKEDGIPEPTGGAGSAVAEPAA